jgi:hypothetical protein
MTMILYFHLNGNKEVHYVILLLHCFNFQNKSKAKKASENKT